MMTSNSNNNNVFYTIGFSKKDIPTFINLLKTNNVNTLVDVRNWPNSQWKPEFNKDVLQSTLLDKANIKYLHVPELGIESNKRQKLKDARGKQAKLKAYEELWDWYDREIIPKYLENTIKIINEKFIHPVVFLCTEFNPIECHRHRIAKVLEDTKGMKGINL